MLNFRKHVKPTLEIRNDDKKSEIDCQPKPQKIEIQTLTNVKYFLFNELGVGTFVAPTPQQHLKQLG